MAAETLPAGDYVSPNLPILRLDHAFPNLTVGDTSRNPWPYLRRHVPQNWYVDRREPGCGFLSRDEAHIVYHTARQFTGKRALEIGCWLGWSAAHMASARVQLDVIDPLLARPAFRDSVTASLTAAGVMDNVTLHPGGSPEKVLELVAQTNRKWSLIFIDGDHEGAAPLKDAVACAPHAEADAIILFHDLASPHVAAGLDYFRAQGWQTMIYETMQIMGVAWRGNVKPVEHRPDPAIREPLPEHLRPYAVSGRSSSPASGTPPPKAGNAPEGQIAINVNDLMAMVESHTPAPMAAGSGDRKQFARLLQEGRQALESGDAARAIQSLQQALTHAASSHQAHHLLATAHWRSGSWRDSFRHQMLASASHNLPAAADEEEFASLLAEVRPYTMLSTDRLRSLYLLARQICLDDVPGAFVECGTWKGGSAALLAATIRRHSLRPRKLYAFDTYEGLPAPTPADRHDGISADAAGFGAGELKAPIEENLAVVCKRMGVQDIVVPVKGRFQHTLPATREQIGQIALLHADGDWYESTLDILNNLYDRVSAHGIVQIDDYGYWEGCRKAVHEFEAARGTWFPMQRIDDTGVWFRKAPDNEGHGSLVLMLRKVAIAASAKGDRRKAARAGQALLKVLPRVVEVEVKAQDRAAAPAPGELIGPPGIPMPIPMSKPNPFGALNQTEAQRRAFFRDLIVQTRNFSHVTWLGYPIWQNILDLWTIQETISEIKPALLVECGTNRGGSALFYAHLFDLIGHGKVVTIDVMTMHKLSHPRVRFLTGSSTADDIFSQVRADALTADGPVMVILDSDHSAPHVRRELELYAPLVTPGSFLLVQDGAIDVMDEFRAGRPGPLVAIEEFLPRHPEFELDAARCERFLITHHPKGWMRRKAT